MKKNLVIIIAVAALVVGGLSGYYIAKATNPLSNDYMKGFQPI